MLMGHGTAPDKIIGFYPDGEKAKIRKVAIPGN
jgi:hypothetical protein